MRKPREQVHIPWPPLSFWNLSVDADSMCSEESRKQMSICFTLRLEGHIACTSHQHCSMGPWPRAWPDAWAWDRFQAPQPAAPCQGSGSPAHPGAGLWDQPVSSQLQEEQRSLCWGRFSTPVGHSTCPSPLMGSVVLKSAQSRDQARPPTSHGKPVKGRGPTPTNPHSPVHPEIMEKRRNWKDWAGTRMDKCSLGWNSTNRLF